MGSDTATFMQNDCDIDHDLDQPRSTTTTTFSGSMPGSAVAGSSRSRGAGPTARHEHSTSRRARWSSGMAALVTPIRGFAPGNHGILGENPRESAYILL